MTRIFSITNYGSYQHILPEEITDLILEDLKKSKSEIDAIIAEDTITIKNLLKKIIKRLYLMNLTRMK
jgi:hypothetical protein